MPELTLNHEQRDTLARHLHRVRVTQLMWREPTPDSRGGGGPAQLAARGRRFPVAPGGWAVDHAEEWADRKLDAELLPRFELLPRPRVHPHFATLVAFAVLCRVPTYAEFTSGTDHLCC